MALLESEPLDVALDADGDALIDGDGLHLIGGLTGIAQLIRIALLLFLGEWFLNLGAGFPWFQEVLGEKFDEQLIRKRVSETILRVPGVLKIKELVVAFDGPTRAVSITWAVSTIFGDTESETTSKSGGGA